MTIKASYLIGLSFLCQLCFSSHVFANVEEKLWESFMASDFENAEMYAREALRNHPEDPLSHYNLGVVLFQKKQFAEAQKNFERATSADDETLKSRAYYNKAMAEIMQSDLVTARESMATALSFALDNTQIKENLDWIDEQIEKQDKSNKQNNSQNQSSASNSEQDQQKSAQADQPQNENNKNQQQTSSDENQQQNGDQSSEQQQAQSEQEKNGDLAKKNQADQQKQGMEKKESLSDQSKGENKEQSASTDHLDPAEKSYDPSVDKSSSSSQQDNLEEGDKNKKVGLAESSKSDTASQAHQQSISVDEMQRQDAEKMLRQVDDKVGQIYYPSELPAPTDKKRNKEW